MERNETTRTAERRRKLKRHGPQLGFVDLAPRAAAPRLGFASADALWAFLRRNQDATGKVDLGNGAYGYRRGRRSWVVRIPTP